MRCPVCWMDIQETALVGAIAQHTCRRCQVHLVEAVEGSVYGDDLLAIIERIVAERRVRHD